MRWRTWLIDWPAAIVTLWWAAYRILLMIITMIVVTTLLISLVLAVFGIRWGW